MANPDARGFESVHASLEADINRLSKEVAEKRTLPQYEGVSQREIVKQSLAPLVISSAAQNRKPEPSDGEEEKFLPQYLESAGPEAKLEVERLIDLTFHEGILKSAAEAQQKGPFVLHAFHDALADKLYEELISRGLI